ncbi:MAG: hypothetical protein R3C18_20340 [Planctomycetaceae bacterium]
MTTTSFQPGFRKPSWLDVAILLSTAIAVPVLCLWSKELALLLAYVVLHFFLFCNVIRLATNLELAWATVAVLLAGLSFGFNVLSGTTALTISLATTVVVTAIEFREPSYHGIYWEKINPGLKQWWDAHKG